MESVTQVYSLNQKGGQMARILISGSRGHLGKALTQALSTSHEVIPLDRDWTTVPLNIDYILHCGAYGNHYDQTSPLEIFRVNVKRTFDLLEATKGIPYKKFIFISTSSVLIPHQTMYSVTKKMIEDLIRAYDKPISIVRPFSVTGIGDAKTHLIPTLIDAAYTGKVIPFVREPSHDFIDIEDVVKGMIKVMTMENGTYNLGSKESYNNQEVLNIAENLTGKKIQVKITEQMRSYDTKKWVSNECWSTKPLQTTIKEMIEDYRKE